MRDSEIWAGSVYTAFWELKTPASKRLPSPLEKWMVITVNWEEMQQMQLTKCSVYNNIFMTKK